MWIRKKVIYVYLFGGISKESFFFLFSFYWATERLILKCTVINLDKLNDSLRLINRKGVKFHQDNARPHTSWPKAFTFWMEYSTMPTIFSRFVTCWLLFVQISIKLFRHYHKTFSFKEHVKNHLDQFSPAINKNFMTVESCSCQKNNKTNKNRQYNIIVNLFTIWKLSFIFSKKNVITFKATQ